MPRELWIGLFESEVTGLSPHFGNAACASVNVVALAESEEEFVSRVRSALDDLGLHCIDYEDVERFEDRVAAYEVHESINEAARQALKDETVAFGTFHTSSEDSDAES